MQHLQVTHCLVQMKPATLLQPNLQQKRISEDTCQKQTSMFAVLHLFRSVLCPYENLVQMEVFPEVPHMLHLMQSRQLPASRHPGIPDLPWHLCVVFLIVTTVLTR